MFSSRFGKGHFGLSARNISGGPGSVTTNQWNEAAGEHPRFDPADPVVAAALTNANNVSWTPPGIKGLNDLTNSRLIYGPEADIIRKFKTPTSPIAAEASKNDIEAPPQVLYALKERHYQEQVAAIRGSRDPDSQKQARLQALEIARKQDFDQSVTKTVNAEFAGDFRNWIMKRGRVQDHVRSGWWPLKGRHPDPTPPKFLQSGGVLSHHSSVKEYVKKYVLSRPLFEQELVRMKAEAATGGVDDWPLNKLYIYYKYVVRGLEPDDGDFDALASALVETDVPMADPEPQVIPPHIGPLSSGASPSLTAAPTQSLPAPRRSARTAKQQPQQNDVVVAALQQQLAEAQAAEKRRVETEAEQAAKKARAKAAHGQEKERQRLETEKRQAAERASDAAKQASKAAEQTNKAAEHARQLETQKKAHEAEKAALAAQAEKDRQTIRKQIEDQQKKHEAETHTLRKLAEAHAEHAGKSVAELHKQYMEASAQHVAALQQLGMERDQAVRQVHELMAANQKATAHAEALEAEHKARTHEAYHAVAQINDAGQHNYQAAIDALARAEAAESAAAGAQQQSEQNRKAAEEWKAAHDQAAAEGQHWKAEHAKAAAEASQYRAVAEAWQASHAEVSNQLSALHQEAMRMSAEHQRTQAEMATREAAYHEFAANLKETFAKTLQHVGTGGEYVPDPWGENSIENLIAGVTSQLVKRSREVKELGIEAEQNRLSALNFGELAKSELENNTRLSRELGAAHATAAQMQAVAETVHQEHQAALAQINGMQGQLANYRNTVAHVVNGRALDTKAYDTTAYDPNSNWDNGFGSGDRGSLDSSARAQVLNAVLNTRVANLMTDFTARGQPSMLDTFVASIPGGVEWGSTRLAVGDDIQAFASHVAHGLMTTGPPDPAYLTYLGAKGMSPSDAATFASHTHEWARAVGEQFKTAVAKFAQTGQALCNQTPEMFLVEAGLLRGVPSDPNHWVQYGWYDILSSMENTAAAIYDNHAPRQEQAAAAAAAGVVPEKAPHGRTRSKPPSARGQ